MIFFDESKPNKYAALKKLLVPKKLLHTNPKSHYERLKYHRYGENDGSYVLPEIWYDFNVLSYGIGNDPEGVSFETSISDRCKTLHMYDGSIMMPPIEIDGEFFSFNVDAQNFKSHVDKATYDKSARRNILKMDIEGHEYSVLSNNLKTLLKFDALCIEFHSLIEEIPSGWELEPQLREAKKLDKRDLFTELNKEFYLWHIHGNNHGPRYVDFPDSIEVTYINKHAALNSGPVDFSFPIECDTANYKGVKDYVLDWWIWLR